jgi:transposase-like protein
MSIVMEEEIKRWTARRKSALVLEVIQGKTSISEASRQFDLPPLRSKAGSRTPSAAWRTRCVPSQKMSANSTSGS